MKVPRTPWNRFPDVIISTQEQAVKHHPAYPAAKQGDGRAAYCLVKENQQKEAVVQVRQLIGQRTPVLVPVHALEKNGVNAIPEAMASRLENLLDLAIDTEIVQINAVGHTGSDGFHRLANQALFDGIVRRDMEYFLVDDFVGQGGTLANLKGHIETNGGCVIGAVVLTGKPFSARLALSGE